MSNSYDTMNNNEFEACQNVTSLTSSEGMPTCVRPSIPSSISCSSCSSAQATEVVVYDRSELHNVGAFIGREQLC